ncbi:histone H2B, gonadal-like [Pituophis catenifer annectens]|uniref:histone H2B, gonadal-like n=1 Tax=Pituophis catenifer annectens TaxID=94852 RepID=UPI003990E49A
MAATTWRSRKKRQIYRRQRNKAQYRQRKPRVEKRNARHVKRGYGKKISRKPPRKMQKMRLDSVRMTNEAQNILHFCVHDLYKKVSLAAERLRKKKRHVSITVSDVRNALKKIMPKKYDRKSVSSISCKCH